MRSLLLAVMVLSATYSGSASAQMPAGAVDSTSPEAQTSPAEDTLLTHANDALEHGDDATAVKLLTQLTTSHPKDPHLLYDLGFAEEGLRHTAEAEAAYRKAIAADAKYFEPHLALGLLLAREDKLPEAHIEFSAAVALPEDNPALVGRAYRALAQLDRTSQPADARDELLLALKLTPESADDALLAAELAEALNDPAEAEAAYRRLLKADPNNPSAAAGLAHVLLREAKPADGGKEDETKLAAAETLLTAALAAHPGDPALTAQLAALYAGEDNLTKQAQAVPLVEALHAQRPNDAAITRLLARLYATSGAWDKSEPLYTVLARQTPKDPTLLADLGSALIHLRRYSEAEEDLKRAVASPQDFPVGEDLPGAYSDLAFAASENNDPATTLHALELRSKIAPKTAASLFLEATSYDKLHQGKQAVESYRAFLDVANGKFPDQEWEAQHRLIALEGRK